MVRFVHSADWQLGMSRSLLDADAQARFTQARIDAITQIGRVAREHGAQLVVVAGDVFESNHLDRRTIHRALERLADVDVPVVLLPGNHDPLDAASVYDRPAFRERCPDHVSVLRPGVVVEPVPGVEVVGAAWTSKRRLSDGVAPLLGGLVPLRAGQERVVVAHGVVTGFDVDRHRLDVIDLDAVEQAVAQRTVSYLALGDRHSTTRVGGTGRVWYAGSPEPTRFTEVDAGNVLVVDVDGPDCHVTPERVATWRFAQWTVELAGDADVEGLRARFDAIADAARTVVRLELSGVVSLGTAARLDALLDEAAQRLAACDVVGRDRDVVAVADPGDLADLDLGPVTRDVVDELSDTAGRGGVEAQAATHALVLLHRLVVGAP